jgi:hypothetical protein
MVSYNDYVAGWLDSSIRDFLPSFQPVSDSMKYALITCLDSNLEPKSLLKRGLDLGAGSEAARPLGKGLLLPTRLLLQVCSHDQLFFGFDEVWFFPTDKIKPKPSAAWLVGPARIDQKKLDKLGAWMSDNSCALALGDGDGLNFVIKARGLAKHLLAHSIDQRQPNVAFVAASPEAVAG